MYNNIFIGFKPRSSTYGPFIDQLPRTDIRQWIQQWQEERKNIRSTNEQAYVLGAITIRELWKHRNEICFNGKAPNPYGVVVRIAKTCSEFSLALQRINIIKGNMMTHRKPEPLLSYIRHLRCQFRITHEVGPHKNGS